MSNGVYALLGRGFPYGTLAVNVLGSLVMGFLYILMIERLAIGAEWLASVALQWLADQKAQ